MKRGSVTKREGKFVALWIPHDMRDGMDAVIKSIDSDRSKFIRNAIRHRLKELGASTREAA